MKGAEAVLAALAANDVDVCFANPGTSEMQMVAAFDRQSDVRPILCLFEGVVTGAADGYGRVAGRPSSTLLHLGPGLGNGLANLHNARRANTPIVNLIGEQATFHRDFDAPLTSDIEAVAKTVSRWVGTAKTADDATRLAGEAAIASLGAPGGSASLILPADTMWSEVSGNEMVTLQKPARQVSSRIDEVAAALSEAENPAILLGGDAVAIEASLEAAALLAGSGYRILVDSFVARLPRGAGRYAPERVPYFGEAAVEALKSVDLLVTVHSRPPVAFFGYPNKPSEFIPDDCQVISLSEDNECPAQSLEALAETVRANNAASRTEFAPPPIAQKFNPHSIGAVIAHHLPENALISEDAATSGVPVMNATRTARAHDWMYLTGGSIGQAMPVALGAAVAAPDRKVVALTGDGAAAYTVQALWTMARENLNVTTIVFANHAYRILNIELERTESGEPGKLAHSMLDLSAPKMDWSEIARGFGVSVSRCTDIEAFEKAFRESMAETQPRLIEVVL